ncbi:putative hemolysin [Pelotomaculum thermopropionicum SI]|uniref:Putative hemolysin n=1 Tax=Pelotomaculum thermopropionicum (strain DSM 13744 / JCM 10971 / SI) TaxID=370438 RepID=A5CZM7_PELTS|nr:putative hemolysin [Pelotomaculum thermopropionicum SI]
MPGDWRWGTIKTSVQFETGLYIVKTAETRAEIEQALRLRHEVFRVEMLNAPLPSGLDTDRFDPLCDHMIVQTRDTGRVVATYRLNPSAAGDYYARREFAMDAVLRLAGRKLEIGRACVARGHRRSAVFALLWRGMAAYLRQAKIRYVFGCSCVPARTSRELALLYQYFRARHFSPDILRVQPLPPGIVPAGLLNPAGGRPADDEVKRLIPPILQFYLRGGSWVCGEPYYDGEFNSYDFFTLLDVTAAAPAARRFLAGVRPAAEEKAGGA